MRILCSEENSDKARKKKILIRQYSSTVQYNKSVQPRRTVTNASPDVGGGSNKYGASSWRFDSENMKMVNFENFSILLSCILTQHM